MALTVVAWVLRAVSLLALVCAVHTFLRGLKAGRILRGGTDVVQPPRIRVLQATGFLILAVAFWLGAGVLQGNMEPGFAILVGAAGAAGAVAGVLRRDVKRRLAPKPPGHLNAIETVSWLLLFVGIGGGVILSEHITDRTLRGLVWGAALFGIFAGGTFIAWAVARLWLRLKPPPVREPPLETGR